MFEPRLQVDVLTQKRAKNELQLRQIQDTAKRSIVASCGENCHQYLMNTTLHGLKYVGDKKITRFER